MPAMRKELNLPNALSLLRVALLPFVLWSLWEEWTAACVLLIVAAAATDYLDGWLARRLGQVSDFGKIIDPLADKVCIDGMAVALSLWRGFPWFATALIIGRDLLILAGGLLLLGKTKIVPVSNMAGKLATGFLALTIICYAMEWQPFGTFLLGIGMLLVLVSGGWYAWDFVKQKRT